MSPTSKVGTITLTIRNFPGQLRNKIRAEAMLRDVNMAELLIQMAEDWLKVHGSTSNPAALDDDN